MEDQRITRFDISLDALRVLHSCVAKAHDEWPGGSAEHQAILWEIRQQLFAALLDATM
tara:strand:- start:342 stop:515 length:174 start_codon:yes stop_codon:yes gene_type:complete